MTAHFLRENLDAKEHSFEGLTPGMILGTYLERGHTPYLLFQELYSAGAHQLIFVVLGRNP